MTERIDRIEELMLKLMGREEPSVFSVSIQKDDHSSLWTAYCTLRADGRHFSVRHEDPIIALVELDGVLTSLVCPYCRSLKKGEQYELERKDKESDSDLHGDN